MRIRHLLTAIAVFASLSVAAFASADNGTASGTDTTNSADTTIGTDTTGSTDTVSTAADGNSAEAKNVDTGIGGVAAVVGIITLAGAAVVISRKKG